MAPEGKTKCNSNCGLLGNVAEPDGSGLKAVSRSQSPGQSAPTGMQWQAGQDQTLKMDGGCLRSRTAENTETQR